MKTRSTFLVAFLFLSFQILFSNGVVIVNGTEGVYLELKSSDVEVTVNSQIAVVTTRQVFYNSTGQKTPIRYAFPLHSSANAIDLKWHINGIWHAAIISKATQSDTIPGSPGGEIDPNLLDYMGESPLLFTPIDSIYPDSSVTFVLKYVELLPYAFGEVNFFYPNDYTSIQWDEPVDHQKFTFRLESERTIESVDIGELDANVQVMSHDALITYEAFEVPANQDYQVYYQLSSTELGVYSLSTFLPDSLPHCDELGIGYVSLIIEPESNVNTEVIEKNFSLIIDRSGSMSGNKIVQARNAASFIVNNLNFGDRFNIIDFSSNVKSLFPEIVPYSLQHQSQALAYINAMSATGSTNISGALTTSIQQFLSVDTTKANIIIFFTDGMATAGITTTEGILEAVENVVNTTESEIFLFTFGIGDDVDKKLLTSLALEQNGIATFLENDDLEESITRFFLTINNPVLLNTQFAFEPNIVTDVYPLPLPNLYKGQQLILSGRYSEADDVTLFLSGKAFNLPVQYAFPIQLADSNDVEKSFLPKIWAKQAIDKLTIDFNLAESEMEADSIQSLIDSLSICYGVISTKFTSFEDGGEITSLEYDEVSIEETFDVVAVPNPFQTDLTFHVISKSALSGPIRIMILDNLGNQVAFIETQVNGLHSEILCTELAELPAGIYHCVFVIGDEVLIRKIIKV